MHVNPTVTGRAGVHYPQPDVAATAPKTPAPTDPAASPARTSSILNDLPDDIKRRIGDEVFANARGDAAGSLKNLASTPAMTAALSDALAADTLVRTINECRDMTGLVVALGDIRTIHSTFRHGCLNAVLDALPRVNIEDGLPSEFWDELRQLVPTLQPMSHGDVGSRDPQVDFLVRLAGELGALAPRSLPNLEQMLALVDPDAKPRPKVSRALLVLASELLSAGRMSGMNEDTIRQRLVPQMPAALRPRLLALCDFSGLLRPHPGQPFAQRMILQMKVAVAAHAADRPAFIAMAADTWRGYSKKSDACHQRFKAIFLRLSPEKQMKLVLDGKSPYQPAEMAVNLQTYIVLLPVATLLAAFALHCSKGTAPISPDEEMLMESLAKKYASAPQLAEVLRGVINPRTAGDPWMAGFIERHSKSLPAEEALAIRLQLDLTAVGPRDDPTAPNDALDAMSSRVDALLAPTPPVAPWVVATLARTDIGWLTAAQQGRLMDHVLALPEPGAAAPLLAAIIPRMAAVSDPVSRDLLIGRAIAACGTLPVQDRAAPVGALLNILDTLQNLAGLNYVERAQDPVAHAVSALYHALPHELKPAFERSWTDVLAPAPAAPAAPADPADPADPAAAVPQATP